MTIRIINSTEKTLYMDSDFQDDEIVIYGNLAEGLLTVPPAGGIKIHVKSEKRIASVTSFSTRKNNVKNLGPKNK